MIELMRRRLISASLLFGLCLFLAAPALALYAADSGKMACCKRGGTCCHTRRHSETGFEGSTECAAPCSLAATSSGVAGITAAIAQSGPAELTFHSAFGVAEGIHSQSTSYQAFLYQLPPPVSAR